MKKMCKKIGCSALAEENGYCHTHQGEYRPRPKRPPSHRYQWMYHTSEWRTFRERFLAEHPVCEKCGALANTVDHLYDHEGNWQLFWNNEFHAYCASCHSKKGKHRHPGVEKSLERRGR